MSEENPQKKKVVVMASAIACWSAVGPLLLKNHPRFGLMWVGGIVVAMVYVVTQFVKLKRSEG